MKRILVFFMLLASVFSSYSYADEKMMLPQGGFSKMRRAGIAKVVQVIDPKTLQLDDGRIIRMSGLNYPDYIGQSAGEYALIALDILRDMLEGEAITLYQTPKKDWGRTNRMGHHLAQIERKSDGAWVTGSLLRLGLARVYTTQRNPEMAAQMYRLEHRARAEKLGLWEQDTYAVLTPDIAAEHIKSFQIVEGHIKSVALKNNRLYLNFGKDWRSDFTVSIPPADKRIFSKQGIDPLQWNNTNVRVRGWIESYNGPYIEINHPQAIEILDSDKSAKSLQEKDSGSMVNSIH